MTSSVITAVFVCLYFGVTIWLVRGVRLDVRAVCSAAVICALTIVLAAIRIPLPTGSNITCGSWVPLMILALVVDARLAIVAGWVCGILVMFLLPGWEAIHWAQIFVQQLVCFSCLGWAGLFGSDRKWKVLCGASAAVLIRITAHVLSGVVFYSQNAWDGWGAWGYSLAYNLSSRLPEGILTVLIVTLLPLHHLRGSLDLKGAVK